MAKWGTAETAHLLYLLQQGKAAHEIWSLFQSEGIDRTQRAIERKVARERKLHPETWHGKVQAPPPAYKKYDEQLVLEADSALILFDIHAPRHHNRFINQCIGVALQWGCNLCIIGGDLIDFDAFSYFGSAIETDAEDEIRATEQIVKILAQEFETVAEIDGNHEDRIVRLLNHKVPPERIMSWWAKQDNVLTSSYRWCELTSGGERFYIEHPRNTSVIPTRVAQGLCSKHLTHVIMGHNHLWGMTKDASGTFWAIEGGICADPKRLPYVNVVHNKRPAFCVGAVIVREGVPWLLSPENIQQMQQISFR